MYEQKGKTALIIVGGAYRSTYYTGVMRALDELGIANNFDTYIGISAGAPIIAYFLADQFDDMPKIWEEYVPSKKLYNPKNLFIPKKPILNLDYLVDDVFQKYYPLNTESILNSKKEFIIPLMHYETRNILYADAKNDNMFQLMKSAMSIPWLTRKFYKVEGQKYIDAGFADHTIIQKIIDDGYSKILVLVNQYLPDGFKNLKETIIEKLFFVINPRVSKTIKYLLTESNNYYKFLNNSNTNVVIISPKESPISKFENDPDKIKKTMDLGYNDVIKDLDLIHKLEIFK